MKKILGIIVILIVLAVIVGAATKKQTPTPTGEQTTYEQENNIDRPTGDLDKILNNLENSFEADTIDDEAIFNVIDDKSIKSVGTSYEI